MARRGVTLVILCEDLQQEVFARKYFMTRFDLGYRDIRVNRNEKGKGSGEYHVREQYPNEVKTYRSKSPYLSSIRLAVFIDTDNNAVEQRLKEMDSMLLNDGQERRQRNEKIAVFTPKRNIETWIHYLMGETINEQTSYQKFTNNEGACKPYVERLASEICPVGLPADAPPSLHVACDELQRLL
ncbi:MAG: hypothetical protein HC875_13460 [Anaerolineales bacterium]|nr:hypothetical protein [Anaerolineales bacterium]